MAKQSCSIYQPKNKKGKGKAIKKLNKRKSTKKYNSQGR